MKRYRIHPVANGDCSELNTDNLLAETDSKRRANSLAVKHSNWPYGSGILDTKSGLIDVGFGFGVRE